MVNDHGEATGVGVMEASGVRVMEATVGGKRCEGDGGRGGTTDVRVLEATAGGNS